MTTQPAEAAEARSGTSEVTHDLDRLITENLDVVQHAVNIVSMRYPLHVDRDELWNAGALGLVDAARRFDPEEGVPFARYAMIRVRGAIIDSTRSRDWATRSTRRGMREIRHATEHLRQRFGREPEPDEVVQHMDISLDEYESLKAAEATANLLHLDQHVGSDQDTDTTLKDLVEEQDGDAMPQEVIEERELVGSLHVAIEHLPEVQRTVVERYYFDGEYLRDIAETLDVTEARVSQIRSEALNAIRAYFTTTFDGVADVERGAPGLRNRAAFVEEMTAETDWRTRLSAADRSLSAVA